MWCLQVPMLRWAGWPAGRSGPSGSFPSPVVMVRLCWGPYRLRLPPPAGRWWPGLGSPCCYLGPAPVSAPPARLPSSHFWVKTLPSFML